MRVGGAGGEVERAGAKRLEAHAGAAGEAAVGGGHEGGGLLVPGDDELDEEVRRLSTTSRFSSPGTPKIRSTPSRSSAATSRSDPLVIACSPRVFPPAVAGAG